MKSKSLFILGLISALGMTQSVYANTTANLFSTTPTEGTQQPSPEDKKIQDSIKSEIAKDSSLRDVAHSISIKSSDGTVIIRGIVKNTEQKDKVIELAKKTNNVQEVKDELAVSSQDFGTNTVR
jgi:osmotically-inducible protein OsmY